jgi:hypothetical protein
LKTEIGDFGTGHRRGIVPKRFSADKLDHVVMQCEFE